MFQHCLHPPCAPPPSSSKMVEFFNARCSSSTVRAFCSSASGILFPFCLHWRSRCILSNATHLLYEILCAICCNFLMLLMTAKCNDNLKIWHTVQDMIWFTWSQQKWSFVLYTCLRFLPGWGNRQDTSQRIFRWLSTLGMEYICSRYVPVCQSDNSTAMIANQKCKSQYLFAYFSLQTLSLLSFTSHCLLSTDATRRMASVTFELLPAIPRTTSAMGVCKSRKSARSWQFLIFCGVSQLLDIGLHVS